MMNDNKTVLLPSAEAGNSLTDFSPSHSNTTQSKPSIPKMGYHYEEFYLFRDSNPYLRLSKPIFKYMDHILNTYEVDNVREIHEHLKNELELFTQNSSQYHLDNAQVLVVRYLLCTYIDELICTTFWGKNSDWANGSLLSHFYKETYGGEKFFQLMTKMLGSPANYLHQLEFMYVCIALGFEGKYRIQTRGKMELDAIKENLYKQIKLLHGKQTPPFYSEPKISKKHHVFFYKVPYTKLIIASVAVLALVYTVLTVMINAQENNLIPLLDQEIVRHQQHNLSQPTTQKEINVKG